MIAEIHHKVVASDSEDQLTGDVFGALRYLPYKDFREILLGCVQPSIVDSLDRLLPQDVEEWGNTVSFWPHYHPTSRTEPDIVIELGEAVILIEVKYNSELSGADQLIREAELLVDNYKGEQGVLLLLAREESALAVYNEQKANIPKEVLFGYMTWQGLLDGIRNNESIVCGDLTALLEEKGFGGFRGFDMMNEETVNAFSTVREAHKTVQTFISHCIALANEAGEFELAPMTGNNTFLRWSGDRESYAWTYSDFFVVFQRCADKKLPNGYRDGALYILNLNFEASEYDVPTVNIARYDYDDIKNWYSDPISPGDHKIFYQPMYYDGVLDFLDGPGELYCGEADEPLEKFWGLKRVMGYEMPMAEITHENAYERIFGTFGKLAGM
ncbi:MAG: hypothetical protein LBP73_08645 [Clostridiales Family XIII bacterium]|jgi:hypothetical protein|nr:hypothetical protein [Clostridiales Family XIII bacterium]